MRPNASESVSPNFMNKDIFWKIIDATIMAPTHEEQLELFRRELAALSLKELDAFGTLFSEYFVASYNWDLWLVAWLARRGLCSDDGFHYLRLWLLSRGRHVFESALQDPESLAELICDAASPEFESFAYVMDEVRLRFAAPPLKSLGRHPKQPSGGDWLRPELKDRTGRPLLNLCVVFRELTDADFEVIQKRFPRLWEICLRKGIIKTPGAPAEPPSPATCPRRSR